MGPLPLLAQRATLHDPETGVVSSTTTRASLGISTPALDKGVRADDNVDASGGDLLVQLVLRPLGETTEQQTDDDRLFTGRDAYLDYIILLT